MTDGEVTWRLRDEEIVISFDARRTESCPA
jgi:hypothetical protein